MSILPSYSVCVYVFLPSWHCTKPEAQHIIDRARTGLSDIRWWRAVIDENMQLLIVVCICFAKEFDIRLALMQIIAIMVLPYKTHTYTHTQDVVKILKFLTMLIAVHFRWTVNPSQHLSKSKSSFPSHIAFYISVKIGFRQNYLLMLRDTLNLTIQIAHLIKILQCKAPGFSSDVQC